MFFILFARYKLRVRVRTVGWENFIKTAQQTTNSNNNKLQQTMETTPPSPKQYQLLQQNNDIVLRELLHFCSNGAGLFLCNHGRMRAKARKNKFCFLTTPLTKIRVPSNFCPLAFLPPSLFSIVIFFPRKKYESNDVNVYF